MSNINYEQVKQQVAKADRDMQAYIKRSADIHLQPGGVAKLCFPRMGLMTHTNILATEALKLIRIAKPISITIRNGDAIDCSRWWSNLKPAFGGELENIKFVATGIKDNWKPNMAIVTPVVKEVVTKLASKKPLVFYVKATEYALLITSVTQPVPGRPKVTHTFEIELVGDWNWRYACGRLLADVLPAQFPNLLKVYMVFGFKCNTCVERVFASMGWTFPEVHKVAQVFLSTVESDDLFFDDSAQTKKNYNEFTLAATNTKIG